jgi:hypothetical protein
MASETSGTMTAGATMARLFAELVDGTGAFGYGYILTTGDVGLVQSLEKLTADDASRATNGGATVAAHVEHVRYGLSLMNRWAAEGGDPFANAAWDAAWKIRAVDAARWDEIRSGLRAETGRWLKTLQTPRDVSESDLNGMVASVAHLAYHLGAIRQIHAQARGPKDGTVSS